MGWGRAALFTCIMVTTSTESRVTSPGPAAPTHGPRPATRDCEALGKEHKNHKEDRFGIGSGDFGGAVPDGRRSLADCQCGISVTWPASLSAGPPPEPDQPAREERRL